MLGSVPLLVIGLAALPGHGVRLQQTRRPQAPDDGTTAAAEPPVSSPHELRPKSEVDGWSHGSTGHSGLPGLATYEAKWLGFARGDGAWPVRAASDVRMVLGVFTTASSGDAAYRAVIRTTWMSQPGVCKLDGAAHNAACSVYATFVVGNNGGDTGEKDFTVLPIPENLNDGKTPTWFRHASTKYPWATHIAKMDMDAYPHLAYIVDSIRRRHSGSSCSNAFGGRPWLCKGKGCPPNRCGLHGDDFLKTQVEKPKCWSYMQGGLYFLSRELAEGASKEGGFWDTESQLGGAEDALAGHAVHDFAVQHQMCVDAVNLVGWDGYWHPGPRLVSK